MAQVVIFLIIVVLGFGKLFRFRARNRYRNRNAKRDVVNGVVGAVSDKLDVQEYGNLSNRDREAIMALDSGDLPAYLKDRISVQRHGDLPWTSSVSINEWLLLKSLGLKPLGLVQGSIEYHLGLSLRGEAEYLQQTTTRMNSVRSHELIEYSGAIRAAYHKAIVRLQEEARLHGAHAVVGVKFDYDLPNESSGYIRCNISGTAVSLANHKLSEDPVICTTSVIEFAKLLQAGTMPVGIGIGVGAYYCHTTYRNEMQNFSFGGGYRNNEIKDFSDAIYHVRNIALRHLEADVRAIDAGGVLGYDTQFSVMEFELEDLNDAKRTEHILSYVCVGTVLEAAERIVMPKIKLQMNIN